MTRPVATEQVVPQAWKTSPLALWVVLSAMCIVLTGLLAQHTSDPERYFATYSILSIGFLAVALALRVDFVLFSRWIDAVPGFVNASDAQILSEWAVEARTFAEGSRSMCFAASLIALTTLLAHYIADYFSGYGHLATAWAVVLTFGSSFAAGSGLYAMCRGSLAVFRLGRLPNCTLIVRANHFGILHTGRTLSMCYVVIASVWFLYTTTAAVNVQHFHLREWLRSPPVLMLSLPTLPAIFLSFIICQVPLHERMAHAKGLELERIDRLLDELKATSLEQITHDRREQTEFLQRQRDHQFQLPEWPFGIRSLFGIGGSTVMAASPILIQAVPEFAKAIVERWH